jgi:hippurate hydrolase
MDTSELADVYRDLHRHPELSWSEVRTAAIVADRLKALGWETTTEVGRTGVVATLRNGSGPTALLRADMDALPVLEETGLPYASEVRAVDHRGNEVPVMHACGHDMHVTCLLGAADVLTARRDTWRGELILVFQPAEELGTGAEAMVDDGLYDRFGRPDVVLGQHVAPLPVGMLGLREGPAFAGHDGLSVTLYGRGGHGSRPESTVDPVVLAAATVLRLQTVVSREIGATETAVVTVGSSVAGRKHNIIPDTAHLQIDVRTFDAAVRGRVLAAVSRIIRAEAQASDAPREPDIRVDASFPAVVNDAPAVQRTRQAFLAAQGEGTVIDPGLVTGSEDVGHLATAAGAPCVYWLLGGGDPQPFAKATSLTDVEAVLRDLPLNHSPRFAPVVEPTIASGVAALVCAATEWLPA